MIKLTDIEVDLLQQLCTDERQISANQSHREMYRLVEAGYVKATSMNPDAVLYTILPLGRQVLEQQPGSASRRPRSFESVMADRSEDDRKARRSRRRAA
jgi:DNA-binding PadR family transcriptional regulator